MALLRGRDYVLPQDVLDIAIDVLSHRLVLSYDAIADGVQAEQAVRRVLQTIPLPQVAPRQRSAPPVYAPAAPAGGPNGYPPPGPAPAQPSWEQAR
jgi:MoxR-like ATPase